MLEANLLNFSCQSYVSLQPKWNEAAFSTWLNLPVALGSSLLPSPPPPELYHPLRLRARPNTVSAPWPWILVLGCPSQAKLLSHHAAVFWHRRTSWMGLPLSTGFILLFLVTLPPFLNFVSCPSQCLLLLHPDIWSGFLILTLRPLWLAWLQQALFHS